MVAKTERYFRTTASITDQLIHSKNNYQTLTKLRDLDETNTFSDDSIMNPGDSPTTNSQKPKSILINHDQDDRCKKPKHNRFVSFTLDDNKRPFTTSIYYGVKSYLHHFYEPINKTSDGNSFVDDDFEFVVEPGRRRRNYWFFFALFLGVLMLVSAACLLILGNTPSYPNDIVVNPSNQEFLNQRSVTFRKKIETWQYFGLILFCAGGVIIMLTLLISANEEEFGCFNISDQVIYHPSLEETNAWIRYTEVQPSHYCNRIPLLGKVTAVQQVDQHIN